MYQCSVLPSDAETLDVAQRNELKPETHPRAGCETLEVNLTSSSNRRWGADWITLSN